jgi:hypothetical protein
LPKGGLHYMYARSWARVNSVDVQATELTSLSQCWRFERSTKTRQAGDQICTRPAQQMYKNANIILPCL